MQYQSASEIRKIRRKIWSGYGLISTIRNLQLIAYLYWHSVALRRWKYLILGKEALVLQWLQVALDQTAQVLEGNTWPTTWARWASDSEKIRGGQAWVSAAVKALFLYFNFFKSQQHLNKSPLLCKQLRKWGMHWLWRRLSPSPPARWWPCGVCRRGRAASEWRRPSWAARPTRGWERARRKTRRRRTTWGTPAGSCRGDSGRRRWPAPCSADQKEDDDEGAFLKGSREGERRNGAKAVESKKVKVSKPQTRSWTQNRLLWQHFYLNQHENIGSTDSKNSASIPTCHSKMHQNATRDLSYHIS